MAFDFDIPDDINTMFEEESVIRTTPNKTKDQVLLALRRAYRTRMAEAMSECENITETEAEGLVRAHALSTNKDWKKAIRDWDKRALYNEQKEREKAEVAARTTKEVGDKYLQEMRNDRAQQRKETNEMIHQLMDTNRKERKEEMQELVAQMLKLSHDRK